MSRELSRRLRKVEGVTRIDRPLHILSARPLNEGDEVPPDGVIQNGVCFVIDEPMGEAAWVERYCETKGARLRAL